jgi:hypothetical protein
MIHIPVKQKDLIKGNVYTCFGGDRRVLDIEKEGRQEYVTWEHVVPKQKRSYRCYIETFLEKTYIDPETIPEYQGISTFLNTRPQPYKSAKTLNRPIIVRGKKMRLRDLISKIVEAGYNPIAKKGDQKSLQNGLINKNGDFILDKKITITGWRYACFLCRENGWDGKIELHMPEMEYLFVGKRKKPQNLEHLARFLEELNHKCLLDGKRLMTEGEEQYSEFVKAVYNARNNAINVSYKQGGTVIDSDSFSSMRIHSKGINCLDMDGEPFRVFL